MLFIYGTVYNSRNRILQSLDSVMKINIERRILITDNYSTAGTYEILRDNGDKYNLMVKQEKCTRGWGDELIVPDLTFISPVNAVLYFNATPVLCDIDRNKWTTMIALVLSVINFSISCEVRMGKLPWKIHR